MLKYRYSYTCVEVSRIPVDGVAGIYQLILGTFPIVDPTRRGVNVEKTANSEALLGALKRAGPGGDIVDLPEEPARSLRNHGLVPSRGRGKGQPKMLGHEGHPAGLSNGKPPSFPAPEKPPGPA